MVTGLCTVRSATPKEVYSTRDQRDFTPNPLNAVGVGRPEFFEETITPCLCSSRICIFGPNTFLKRSGTETWICPFTFEEIIGEGAGQVLSVQTRALLIIFPILKAMGAGPGGSHPSLTVGCFARPKGHTAAAYLHKEQRIAR